MDHPHLTESELAARGMNVTSIDQHTDTGDAAVRQYAVDLDQPWAPQFPPQFPNDKFNCVLALDVLEHLKSPEFGVKEIFGRLKRNGGCTPAPVMSPIYR